MKYENNFQIFETSNSSLFFNRTISNRATFYRPIIRRSCCIVACPQNLPCVSRGSNQQFLFEQKKKKKNGLKSSFQRYISQKRSTIYSANKMFIFSTRIGYLHRPFPPSVISIIRWERKRLSSFITTRFVDPHRFLNVLVKLYIAVVKL